MAEENIENTNEFELAETDDILDQYLETVEDDSFVNIHKPDLTELSSEETARLLQETQTEEARLAAEAGEPANDDTSNQVESDLLYKLLEARGIKDGLVRMQEEDGTEVDIHFNDLTEEEQFNILSENEVPADQNQLNENEQSAVDFLRQNNVSLEQAIEYFTRKAVEEALAEKSANTSVANYTDEEIYAFDLLSKYKDLTEEEIQIELEKQQEHPELFKKKVDSLRDQYLQAEKDQLTQEEESAKQLELQEFQKITETLIDVAKDVEDYGGIDIEVADKQEVLGFILDKDVNGATEFGKMLDDPKALFEIAWYAKKGKEAFDTLHEYYKKEITEANRKGYEKAKTEIKAATPTKKDQPSKVIIKNKTTNPAENSLFNRQTHYPGVETLYDDLLTNPNK